MIRSPAFALRGLVEAADASVLAENWCIHQPAAANLSFLEALLRLRHSVDHQAQIPSHALLGRRAL